MKNFKELANYLARRQVKMSLTPISRGGQYGGMWKVKITSIRNKEKYIELEASPDLEFTIYNAINEYDEKIRD